MMNMLPALTILACVFAVDVLGDERELLVDSQLPEVGKDWVRRDDGASGSSSWVNFDNSKNPGEVLSFVALRVSSPVPVDVRWGVIGMMSIEAFSSNGSASRSTSERGTRIAERLRHRYMTIKLAANDVKHDFEVIEYTYIYSGDTNSAATMAHGYCAVVGETVVCVQHTSKTPIVSELAFSTAGGILARHLQLAGKPHSVSRGKVLQSND